MERYIKLLKWIGDMIFPDKWKGYRTIVINFIMFLIGLVSLLMNADLYDSLCNVFHVLCNVTEGQFWATLLTVYAFLNKVLRAITDTKL